MRLKRCSYQEITSPSFPAGYSTESWVFLSVLCINWMHGCRSVPCGKWRKSQPALRDMLRHFYGLYSHRPWLSTNQRARIRSVIVKLYLVLASIHALCHDLSQRRLEILPLPALFPSAPRLILRDALLSKLQSSVKYTIFFYYLKDSVVTWS